MRSFLLFVLLFGCSPLPGTGGSGPARDCGSERVRVKLAIDGVTLNEPSPLPARTVAQLSALQAPQWHEDMARAGVELDVVTMDVYLRAVKLEADGDLHVLISDTPDGPTMIAEGPDPECAASSPYSARMGAARAKAAELVGAVFGPKFRELNPPKHVQIDGPAFWDKIHGQKGRASNGIEIHPVLGLRAL